MAEIKLYAAGTDELGNESVTAMLRNILSVNCVLRKESLPVDEVHHKLPLSEGGTHERSNLIALCKSCHAKIHAERGDYHGSKKHRVYSYDKRP